MTFSLPESLIDRLNAEAARRGCTLSDLIETWMNKAETRADHGVMADFHILSDANPDLIARFNPQLQYTYVNPSSARLLGKPFEEITGRTFYDMPMSHELADHLTHELKTAIAKRREHWCEFSLQGRKRTFYYEVQMIPVIDLTGEVESVVTVGRDITARRQAEAALKESEARFRGIVEGQIDLVCLYWPDTRLAYVNDAYCEYFGKTREELIGFSFLSLTLPEEQPRVFARIAEVLENPKPKIEEYRLTDSNGTIHWIHWVDHGITDGNGKVIMVQAIGRDITHIKEVEQQLFIERERYQMLFDTNPLPLWVMDMQTEKFLAVNDAAVRTYGYSREEFLSMSVMDIRPAEDIPKLRRRLQERLAGENLPPVSQWRHRKKDGTLFEVEINARNIQFDGRAASLVLAIDLTERRALEAERMYAQSLEIELKKEREITELKERFTSMVTHEFRTPLSVIISTVDILQNYLDKLTKENMAQRLDIVTAEARRMTALLDDVLTISRAHAGRLRVHPETLNLLEIVQTLVENVRLTDRDQHVFEVTATCDSAPIVTDRRLVEQILINLLTNAVKYSPQGTTITAEVCIDDDHVTLRIKDHGRGVPEEDHARLFDPFHRAANATGVEGSGLGLAIVKESVAVLGGQVRFKSKVGIGTTFIVDLPLTVPMPQPYGI